MLRAWVGTLAHESLPFRFPGPCQTPAFGVVRAKRAQHPLGQAAISVWARFRLDSPSSRAIRSVFLARPR